MKDARYSHSATLLDDGRILVAGGIGADGKPLQSVEIWNPDPGEWTPGVSLPQPLRDQGAVLLGNGNVLLAGAKPGQGGDGYLGVAMGQIERRWLPAGRSSRRSR